MLNKWQEKRWHIIWMPHKKLTTEEIMDLYKENALGKATCLWCGKSSGRADGHMIMLNECEGMGPWCEPCNSEMSLQDKIDCALHLLYIWREEGHKGWSDREIIEAVKRDHGEE